MDRDEQHLSAEQIDLLQSVDLGAGGTGASDAKIEELRAHLAVCERCRRLVSMDKEVLQFLGTLKQDISARESPNCIDRGTIYEVAAGIADPELERGVIRHIAACDSCGVFLREAMEELSGELNAPESVLLDSLKSSQSGWQKELAAKLAATGKAGARGAEFTRIHTAWNASVDWRWSFVGIAAVLLLAILGGMRIWHQRPAYADRLLAEAYTSRRTLEYRIPGARYAPVRLSRGQEADSNLLKPSSLLEAESLIGRSLERNPNDVDWLRAEARAELLEGNYSSAISILNRALELKPEDPILSVDLASAYAQRASQQDDPGGWAKAVEILGNVLASQPHNLIALYNRALALEHIFLYSEAISDWTKYLELDPNSDWADDVRQRLEAARQKERERDRKSSEQLLQPEALVQLARSSPEMATSAVERSPEQYVEQSFRTWFPKAFAAPGEVQSGAPTEMEAMRFVAETLEKNHKDAWLAELSGSVRSFRFREALADLDDSIASRDTGDYSRELRLAKQSAQRFRAIGNVAGEARAREEAVFALHLSHNGSECLKEGAELRDVLGRKRFRWLKAQSDLEEGVCEMMMGDFAQARKSIERSVVLSAAAEFETLHLRALGISSDFASTVGNTRDGWQRVCLGLAEYWAGAGPPMIGYNFYTDMDTAAEIENEPHVQVAVWKEALGIIESDPDVLLRAMAHFWMGKAAFTAGISDLAETEFTSASILFASAPQSRSTRNDRLEAEVALARVEALQGQSDRALDRLEKLQSEMSDLSNQYVLIRYYAVKGAVELEAGRVLEAERSLRSGVALAETGLQSFDSVREAISWRKEVKEAYRNLAELELQRGDAQSALELWEWYRGGPLRWGMVHEKNALELSPSSLADGPELPTLHKVTALVAQFRESTIISFMALREHLVIWVFDDRGIFVRSTKVPERDLERLAQRFGEACRDRSSDQAAIERDGRRLYDLLIAPIESLLEPGRSLVFELDEPLERIPTEALVDEGGHFLLDRAAVSSSPGVYYREIAHERKGISSKMSSLVVGVGASPLAAEMGLLPLPDVGLEAERVASHLESPRLLVDSAATLTAVREWLPTTEIFHFAGHAVHLPVQGLVLGAIPGNRGDLLTADVLDARNLGSMQLAVLSACRTDSELDGGGAPDSLEFALILGGVPRIVDSRWSVDTESAVSLMGSFYDAVNSGQDVARAMRSAQRDIRSRPQWSHPYFWASFRVMQTG